ncbi:MAG TPA: hypothetical protein VHV77_07905 [Pirellulales bacterium]|nr:hypothetical protein [Pirellulales bacterium]
MIATDVVCFSDRELSSASAPMETNPNPGPLDTTTVIELLLKDQRSLDRLLRDETAQRALIPRLLAIALGGFAIYGVTLTAILNLSHSTSGFWFAIAPPAFWNHASVGNLTVAYCLGLIAANGICLPSFYFYTLLAGVRVTMVGIVVQALRGMAAGAVALVGILPIFVAMALNVVIYGRYLPLLNLYAILGLALPFIAGTWGAFCQYRGFMEMCDTIPERRRTRRTCMLRRLIIAWSGCYTFVTPLVIYSLWEHLARMLH